METTIHDVVNIETETHELITDDKRKIFVRKIEVKTESGEKFILTLFTKNEGDTAIVDKF